MNRSLTQFTPMKSWCICRFNGIFLKNASACKTRWAYGAWDLHFVHSEYKHAKDPLSQHVNKMYAYSGHYRTLVDMLAALDAAGFHLDQIKQIPIEHYQRTMDQV